MTDTPVFRPSRRSLLATGLAVLAAPAVLTMSSRMAAAQSLADIKSKGKLVVGIQGDNPPWGFLNSQGVQEGYDADIAKLLGKELGLPVEFVPTAVANRIPALVTGRVDVLFATMGMYPDRAKAIQFSKPYAANDIVLVAPKSTVIKTNADMKNFIIGVARSSAQDTAVTKAAPEGTTIRRFDDDAATIQAMLSGQVQAVGANQFYPLRLNKAQPDTYERKLDFVRQYNGAGTRLGQKEWNATINAFIDKIKANGELAKVYQTWMGFAPPEFPETLEGIPFTVG
ncbi:polar amino acid transport system substrate-binding protein [Azospirillum agricola]|uniref:transporter substrate-binding domain-containing protein n=1 Tax=Azospirillum agricola TaxID=1720247 RepID=UPI001AE3C492|nr:transporter substrate-binding domain-containing protein [Azospirillum agricola]MBP2231066.1 polar amino acid transport system substrate-binding protein [Azospirillum agricola]